KSVELMTNTGVKVMTTTMAQAKVCKSAGQAVTYLMKRMYTLQRLANSTLSETSELGYEQLPEDETLAIQGFAICTLRNADGNLLTNAYLNHLMHSVCGQARFYLLNNKKWKVKLEEGRMR
uniref:Uncharacterized protein n=2 Tax=Clytia hemisphaerica TaxID=252671 RepID=A0A7M5XJ66_9CNID